MTTERLKYWLGIPAAVVGALLAIYGAFTFVDEIVRTPERLDTHIVRARVIHDSTWKATNEIHKHAEDQEKLLEGIVRGECIENPKANLARQGLLAKCRDLGINR